MKSNKISLFFLFFLIGLIFLSISSIHATDNITEVLSEKDISSLNFENEKIITKNNQNNDKKESANIILNSNNFNDYVTDGKFNENVSDGDTIDIQGKLDSPKFDLNVNKAVNIISSTGDAYIDFNTKNSNEGASSYTNGMLQITSGSKGTNITGITFHNTRIWIKDTENVHIDNITDICETNIGTGVGSFSIRGNSNNITVTNSYFKTIHNGGHSNVVVAGATNCLFENNTVEAWGTEGNVGNTFYLTTYGGSTNTNITIRNNTIRNIIPEGVSMAICWGLVLEGNGHIIENNHLSGSGVVKAQYADINYGVVTEIDGIIFRNNYVEGGPELTFPGIAYNNTVTGMVKLGNGMKAFNNSFNGVMIYNNTIFENNTAKNVIIDGDNNTLNNNEVYSNDNFAVTVSGVNNTLTNNKFASLNGRGENAISNSTDFNSINNSEDISRIFYINDDNCENYFDFYKELNEGSWYFLKSDSFKNDDFIFLNTSKICRLSGSYIPINITFQIDKYGDCNYFYLDAQLNLTLINTFGPNMTVYSTRVEELGGLANKTLINSTVFKTSVDLNMIDSEVLTPKYNILSDYAGMASPNAYLITKSTGLFKDEVTSGSQLLLHMYDSGGVTRQYATTINIDRSIGLTAMPSFGRIESNVNLISGSEYSNFTGVTFDGKIDFIDNLNFVNCTFNKDVTLNDVNSINFERCIFNGNVSISNSNLINFVDNEFNLEELINVTSSRKVIFENNTITTNSDNTIIFDDESIANEVHNNVLTSSSLIGDDSVIAGDNIVEDNTPAYNTSILINEDLLFKNDINQVTVTVFNLYNNTPVDQGYVEVYLDGVLQGVKTLNNGQITLDVNITQAPLGIVPLKVWYYDGIRYANNMTSKDVTIAKSNVTIDVEDFTVKMNEEASITATFLNQKGNPVQATNVTFTVGGLTYTTETVDGIATINELVTTEWLDAGKIIVSVPENDKYSSNSTNVKFIATKADILITPKVTVEGSTASINLALTDELNNNVTDGKVTITTTDGTQLASGRVNNGLYTATVTIPDNYESEYLVANYTGSFYYNDLARNVKLSLMLNSTITLETNDPVYGEELVITGKLEDSKGNTIGDANVTVNINGNKGFVSTDSKGEYTYTYTPSLGLNTITATFNGNDDVYGTSITKEITIRDTDHDMNDVLNQLDEITKANEQLQEQLALQNEILAQLMNIISDLQQQNNNLSDKLDQQAQANDELSQQLNDTTNALTQQNNELKEQLQETTNNLTGQIDELNDKVNNLTQANSDLAQQLNDTTNNLTDQNNELKEQLNNLTQANDELSQQLENTTNALTEQNNELKEQLNNLTQVNDEISQLLENTTNALTEQNNNLKDQLANQSQQIAELEGKISQLEEILENLTASEQTTISISPVVDAQFNDEVTITGVLSTTKGNSLSNQVVTVSVNGNSVNVTTVNGVFEYRTVVKNIGDNNNITVSYEGTDKYNPSSANTTFTVDKADCIITIDDVTTVKYGENVIITGTFTNGAGKAIANSKVKLQLNGVYAYVKTDKNGVFTWTTAANRAGENTIVASYGGSSYYNSYKTNATFNVEKQDLMITADDVSYSDGALTIKGTFKNVLGTAVKNTNVRISLNGKIYYVKTDENGTFLFTQAIVANKITYVLGYGGSATYNAYTGTKTTLTVA